jgi:two-component system chemotaxis response regulator CheY
MISLDDKLAHEFLDECGENLATMKTGFLATIEAGAVMDNDTLNRVFRAAHSIGMAGLFGLGKVGALAHRIEDVLALILSREMPLTLRRVRILLRATDSLQELIQNSGGSTKIDISGIMAVLEELCADHRVFAGKRRTSAASQKNRGGKCLQVLLVEDDFISRLLLQLFLSRHGECHVALNGREAVEAFRSSLEKGRKYDLICMDIMMPEMDGREAVRQVRALEEARGIPPNDRAKIIMTTAVTDLQEVVSCFREFCDAYLVKPIDLAQLLGHMKSFELVT